MPQIRVTPEYICSRCVSDINALKRKLDLIIEDLNNGSTCKYEKFLVCDIDDIADLFGTRFTYLLESEGELITVADPINSEGSNPPSNPFSGGV